MTQYINKDDLVTEIEKLIDEIYAGQPFDSLSKEQKVVLWYIKSIMSFIYTLEVKDVDFETAFVASIDHFDEKNNYGQWPESDLRGFAEHFFELGLKAQKGE